MSSCGSMIYQLTISLQGIYWAIYRTLLALLVYIRITIIVIFNGVARYHVRRSGLTVNNWHDGDKYGMI